MVTQANHRTNVVDPSDLSGLLAGWAQASHGTLPQQLARALRRAIDAGLLPDGTRLPPERTIAATLAVSRATVTAALDELRGDGIVESRQGSGSVVRSHATRSWSTSRIAEHFSAAPGIDLAVGNPADAAHLPPVHLDVAALLAGGSGPGIQPLGLPALRTALAGRHTADDRLTNPQEIHVTAGGHQAIALALGALIGPGDAVAVDDPSYPGVFDILDRLGAKPAAVATDHIGLDPRDLDRVLTREGARVVYLQTGPHNPTGRAPKVGRQRDLAEVCDRHGVTVVEDCALADLVFSGRVRPELADLCRVATTITIGSLSKIAWGGLRIGWLRAPATIVERTLNLRLGHDLGPSVPAQLMALQLFDHLGELAVSRRAVLAERVDQATGLIAADLPGWEVRRPEGGSVLWARLPVSDAEPYVALARRHGVHITPGSIATSTRDPDPHVRICVDRPPAEVREGLLRLTHAWRELTSTRHHALG